MVDLNITLLTNTLMVSNPSRNTERMTRYLTRYAERKGYAYTVDHGNVYMTKGTVPLYPCFVAHTDSVHAGFTRSDQHILRVNGNLIAYNTKLMKQVGTGGDDKLGIALALQAMDELPAAKAAFFRDEEIGCVGAALADLNFFKNCAFALQADRRGWEDVVIEASGIELVSAEFKAKIAGILKIHNRKFCEWGAMTDVQDLKENGMDICALNLSCGYYNAHTDTEYINLYDAEQTLNLMLDLTAVLDGKRWAHTAPARSYSGWNTTYDWNAPYRDQSGAIVEWVRKPGANGAYTDGAYTRTYITCPACDGPMAKPDKDGQYCGECEEYTVKAVVTHLQAWDATKKQYVPGGKTTTRYEWDEEVVREIKQRDKKTGRVKILSLPLGGDDMPGEGEG